MIGERIRTRRNELNMSLRDLADKVELTAGFLSQIERDLADPSIKSLRKIAEALAVPILYFLAEDDGTNPVVRKDQRKKLLLPNTNVTYELLTPDLNRQLEMFMAYIQPTENGIEKARENVMRPIVQPTEECILVLQGKLYVQIGDEEYTLEAGDSVYIEGTRLQAMKAVGEEETILISAITPAAF